MKKFLFSICLSALFISCKNNQPDHDDAVIPAKTAMAVQNNALPASMPITTNVNAMPATSGTPQQIQIQNPGPALGILNKDAAGASGKMNPSHGQPGHRCDIPVGAPLSTPLQKPVTQNAPQQGVSSKPLLPQMPMGKGLNPAHGQPGHRCDIAVGAPLSSPVQKAPAQGVAVPQPMASPIVLKTPGAEAGSTAKLNPPHGQPGHDCKIAVGQPLK